MTTETATIPTTYTDSLTLARMVAVHRAAHDGDRCSAVLPSLSVVSNGKLLTICATDGKLLIEESFELTNHSEDAFAILLSPDTMKALAAWLKSAPKLNKAKVGGWVVTITVEGRNVTLTGWGSSMTCKTVEGTFPNYAQAFTFNESAPGQVPRQCEKYGINLEYLAQLSQCWGIRGVVVHHGRGLIFSPLNPGTHKQRALIMPISIPN